MSPQEVKSLVPQTFVLTPSTARRRPWRRLPLTPSEASELRASQVDFCRAALDGKYAGKDSDLRSALVEAFPEMAYFVGLEIREDATLCDGAVAIAEQTLAAACMVVELASPSGRTKWSGVSAELAALAAETLDSAERLHRTLVLNALRQLHRVALLSSTNAPGGDQMKPPPQMPPQTAAALLALDTNMAVAVRRLSMEARSSKAARSASLASEKSAADASAAVSSAAVQSSSKNIAFPSYEALETSERAATLDVLASGFRFRRVCFGEAIEPELKQLAELSSRHGEGFVYSAVLASCVGELTSELTAGAAAAAGSAGLLRLVGHGIETCRAAALRERGDPVSAGTMSQFVGLASPSLGVNMTQMNGLVRLCCMVRGRAEAAGWLQRAVARLPASTWSQLER